MSGPDPSVTIVIPTHERPAALARLLASIGSSRPSWLRTIVVVDDSKAADDPADRYPHLPIEYRWTPERLFISRAKNLGLAAVRTPLAFFVDDDNLIPTDTIPRLVTIARERPRFGAVMPAVLYHRRPDLVWVYATPFQESRWDFALIGRNQPRRAEFEVGLLATDALPNAALYQVDALRGVGGFDEQYPVNSSAAICRTLKMAGYEVWACPEVFLLHDVEPPGTPWYWVEHVARDPERAFFEVADWFRFRRVLHGAERGFAWNAAIRSLAFLLPNLAAVWLRSRSRRVAYTQRVLAGVLAGLRTPSP